MTPPPGDAVSPPRPRVLVTTDRRDPTAGPSSPPAGRVRPARAEIVLKEAVVDVVRAAGGLPLLLPPGALSPLDLRALLADVHAVIVTGGAFDIHPRHYGQAIQGRLDRVDEARTGLELPLCAACLAEGVPVLGICGGMQALAVAAGGSLVQDIGAQVVGALEHEQPTDPAQPWHPVELEGALAAALGPRVEVNSTHHQAVADPGVLAVVGRAPDGVVEAVALPGHPFAVGVQWHPELLSHGPSLVGLLLRGAGRS